jgi:hypothetical protein
MSGIRKTISDFGSKVNSLADPARRNIKKFKEFRAEHKRIADSERAAYASSPDTQGDVMAQHREGDRKKGTAAQVAAVTASISKNATDVFIAAGKDKLTDKEKDSMFTIIRVFALFNFVVGLSFFIPNTSMYVVPIAMGLMFVIACLAYAYKDKLTAACFLCSTGILMWYVILIFDNRAKLDQMPESWHTYNYILGGLVAVQSLLVAIQEKFFICTWVTMAALVAILTIQHITITNLKTDG